MREMISVQVISSALTKKPVKTAIFVWLSFFALLGRSGKGFFRLLCLWDVLKK
jgi:hypothetical protein